MLKNVVWVWVFLVCVLKHYVALCRIAVKQHITDSNLDEASITPLLHHAIP
jgi:hypothetical protein